MNIEEYRRKDAEKIIQEMESDALLYRDRMKEKKKIGKLCSKLDMVVTTIGILTTLVFTIIGTNDIINPKISIIISEAIFTICSSLMLIITRIGNMYNKKYHIFEKIRNFSLEQLNHFKILYSNIYEDGEIKGEEYESIIKFKDNYDHKKSSMKNELGEGYVKIVTNNKITNPEKEKIILS